MALMARLDPPGLPDPRGRRVIRAALDRLVPLALLAILAPQALQGLQGLQGRLALYLLLPARLAPRALRGLLVALLAQLGLLALRVQLALQVPPAPPVRLVQPARLERKAFKVFRGLLVLRDRLDRQVLRLRFPVLPAPRALLARLAGLRVQRGQQARHLRWLARLGLQAPLVPPAALARLGLQAPLAIPAIQGRLARLGPLVWLDRLAPRVIMVPLD